MKNLLLASALVLATTNLFALSQKQIDTCKAAYKIGQDYNLGNTLAGIAYVESRCGMYKIGSTGDYGVTQIHLGSLIDELQLPNTHMNRSKLATQLVIDDEFAYALAVEELLYWKLKRNRTSWWHFVSSYNQGSTIQSYNYAQKVANAIRFLKEQNVIPSN